MPRREANYQRVQTGRADLTVVMRQRCDDEARGIVHAFRRSGRDLSACCQRFWLFGLRFSMKAATPSL